MKKFNWKMILGIGALALAVLLGGLFFYAYKKISPEEIKRVAIEQIQKAFPKATVEIGEIKLTPSLSFKLQVDKVKLATKKDGHDIDLFSAQELKVKIPLWAALTGTGRIEVKLDKPAMNYAEFQTGDYANNWTYAMDIKPGVASVEGQADKKNEDKKEPTQITLPGFLTNIKADIRVYDIAVDYALKDASRGQVTLSRFVVKDISLKGQTAFELESKLTFNMKNNQTFGFDTLVVGQVNLSEFIESQKLSTAIMVQLSNIKSSLLPKTLPDIKTDLKVNVDKSGKIDGDLVTTFNTRNKISANYSVTPTKTRIENISVALFIKDLVEMLDMKAMLGDVSDSAFNLSGNVELNVEGKGVPPRILPDFKFSVSPELEIPTMAGKAKVKFEGSYKGESIQTSIVTQILEGVAEVMFKGEFDPNMRDFDIKKFKPFNLNVKVSHLNVTKDFIQKILYSKKAKAKEEAAATPDTKDENGQVAENNKAPTKPLVLPAGTVSVVWEKINLDKNPLDGRALILVSNDKVITKSMTFSFSEGKGELSHLTQIENSGMSHKFDFKLMGLNMAGLHPFLPPMFEAIKGTFSGLVKGNLTTPNKGVLKYDVAVDVNAKKGELKGVNISEYVDGVVEKLPDALKSKISGKKLNADGNFETLLFKGVFKSEIYQIEKLKFIGMDNKVDVEGNGQIFPPPSTQNGTVDLNIIENTGYISAQLEKYAGTKVLPIRLTGPGFLLKPDYQYTIEKLAKGTVKKQASQVVDKAKELLQQKLKEQMSGQGSGNAKEEIKGVLKGLFKKK